MSVSAHVRKRLLDLLEERRVVVWFDGEGALKRIAETFAAPRCTVVLCSESKLRARRHADEALSRLNDPDQPLAAREGNLLIYAPWFRSRQEEDQVEDPFEAFAVIGTAFGSTEAEQFASLARQALPDRIAEIDRLFREGQPTLDMVESLGEGSRYPLLQQALGTESGIEAAALLLCKHGSVAKISSTKGAREELLRLLAGELGFVPVEGTMDMLVQSLGRYVLFSEFAFDVSEDSSGSLPEALANVPRADAVYRERVLTLCERLRGTDDTREEYVQLASRVEKEMRLAELAGGLPSYGVRDTFPFEERVYLAKVQELAGRGDLARARQEVTGRRYSLWPRQRPDRGVLWKLAERCLDLLDALDRGSKSLPSSDGSPARWVEYYTSGQGFWEADRQQRLVEQSAAACGEDDEASDLLALCRKRYRDLAERLQSGFLIAVGREGWPPEGVLRQTQIFDRIVAPLYSDRRKTAYFLVDALRYEMGQDLAKALEPLGNVSVTAAATVVPATTPFGMAALMPAADGAFRLVEESGTLVPQIGRRCLPNSKARMDLFRAECGDRFHELTLGDLLSFSGKKLQSQLQGVDFVVVRTQDIDALGEGPSLYHARKFMTEILGELRAGTDRLAGLGFDAFVFAADHGHVLLPEVAPGDVSPSPPGTWKLVKRRSRLGSSTGSSPGTVVLPANKMGIQGPVDDLAVPTGFRVFEKGESYFHEGVSLQECVVPAVLLHLRERVGGDATGVTVEIAYRSDRFTSRVIGLKITMESFATPSLTLMVRAFDGSGPKAKVVGEAADCDARDPATGRIALEQGKETQVPLRIGDDIQGDIEIRALDPQTQVVLARLKLKNALME